MDEEKRIWSLRLNLDDFNSEYLKLRNDGDRFAFFLGFHCGCMNGDLAESDPKPFESGYGIGSAMHSKALALSQANAGSAKSSVDTRRLKYGTAQPSKRTPSERSSERSGNAQANAERSPERLSSLTIEPSNDVTREPKTKKPKSESFSAGAEEIYKAYPLKVAPDKAKAAIEKAIAKVGFDQLMTAVKLYAESRKGEDPKFTKQPSGWFNDGRYLDDPSTWVKTTKQSKNGVKHDGFANTDYLAGLSSLPVFEG